MSTQRFMHRARSVLELALTRAILGFLTRIGPVRASNAGGWLFRMLGPWLPVTRTADKNLSRALPELSAAERRRVIYDMWDSLGRTAGEFPHLAALRRDTPDGPGWEVVNGEVLSAQAVRGGPAIFVSGHMGNWEMLPPAVATFGIAFSSVYRASDNPSVDEVIIALRRRAMGAGEVPMFAKGALGARQAMAHVRRGGYLGMLVDQKMNDGIQARLFGLPAMTAPAAAAFALRFGCPVIPGHVERLGPARLRLVVGDPLPLPSSGDRRADLLALTQAINDQLEAWIRARPSSWLWLHRRFMPDGTQ
jgi:KDO2-lipid IV(A) lauroyltransferase